MKSLYDIIHSPLVTEKGTVQQADNNKYMFRVDPRCNKKEIKMAIEEIYNVKVTKVHTLVVRGKLKRVRYKMGKTADWKKAIVTLKQGDTIDYT